MRHVIVPALVAAGITAIILVSCDGGGSNSGDGAAGVDTENLTSTLLVNEAAYIPPQCYTRTIDMDGVAHNPCYSCHVASREPNYIDDPDLQLGYTFAEYANTNRWTNLFVDRSDEVAAISDAAILEYVRTDNYLNADGQIRLAQKLADVPSGWDMDADGQWDGYMPDTYLNFDGEGFDRAPGGGYTGWRTFAYHLFLGTFWPTNGSTDDVMIRLPESFRKDESGIFDLTVYKTNLAIVEAMIRRQDVTLEEPFEENGVDLDKDGNAYGTATTVVYDWAPLEGRMMYYVGQARLSQDAGEVHLAAGLYPEGTEFLHSVRYIDIDEDTGDVRLAARLKELRYARKTHWMTYSQLQDLALAEVKEARDFPDRLRTVIGNVERGVSNAQGWIYQGFIEDRAGELRPQTYEESVFCVGCHGGVGATDDGIFSFSRRLGADAFQKGWYHWTQKGLRGTPEPQRADGHYEYSYYLENNGAGDEFRANAEVVVKFFDTNGDLIPEELETLHSDVAHLLFPSRERALALNKAYRVIVEEQSYIHGRDATVLPVENVHREVEPEQSTGNLEMIAPPWES